MWSFEKEVRLRGEFAEAAAETMGRSLPLALLVLLLLTSCATPYAYKFDRLDGGVVSDSVTTGCQTHEDADVRAELRLDPTGERAIFIGITNQTDQVLQVEWTKLTMTRTDGLVTTLRPDTDLGWIEPGHTQSARLIPFALPASGDAARALEGQRFQLKVPMLVRRESKTYCYDFLVHVQESKGHK